MNRWLDAFIPKPNESIPGGARLGVQQIKVPTLIIRGGEKDYDHPKRTSMEIHSPHQGIPADRAALAGGRLGASGEATRQGPAASSTSGPRGPPPCWSSSTNPERSDVDQVGQ